MTDMLSLQSWLPPEVRETTGVITNGFGSQEAVQESWIRALSGKTVYVVGDADHSGKIGAARWSDALLSHAKSVHNVQLPFEMAQTHGKDVRDFLIDRQTAFSCTFNQVSGDHAAFEEARKS
jgi:hypothetical protein